MRLLAVGLGVASLLMLGDATSQAADPPARPATGPIDDIRLRPQRTLRDASHPWTPPVTRERWEQEAERIRRQILVSNGLWPLPEKTPLEPVVHGLSDRGDYTVEKVFFRSRPGVYVTGSLYRPKASAPGRKRPGILCPHGHWQDGRFYDAGDKGAADQLKTGAETFLSGAHSPLQARMIQLARMGCTVLFYDMVGTADNSALPHREAFNDVEAELWLQNKMGLQTWNSIRALDFLESLPDVDSKRIGVTGASGGGTQTFILCAIDPRPAVAFPAVMVGTAMQGGCQCENASYLRHDINNVAIAALMAPRPLGMTGANDWTIDIESKGLPELKKIYGLYGQPENVEAKCFPQFPHNYNEVSREVMFAFLAKHLGLENAPVKQTDFWPMTRDELTVFDDKHPQPGDWLNAEALRAEMTKDSKGLLAGLVPKDRAGFERYQKVVGGALDIMLGRRIAAPDIRAAEVSSSNGVRAVRISAAGRQVPVVVLEPKGKKKGETVLWLDGRGKAHLEGSSGKPTAAVQKLLEAGYHVASADLFLTGEFLGEGSPATYPVNEGFPGYTYCYNPPLIAHRVRDIVLAHDWLVELENSGKVHLVGTGGAGLWALLAQAQMQTPGGRTVVDLNRFTFKDVSSVDDPNLFPGALKYGDVPGLAVLAAPSSLTISGDKDLNWEANASASRAVGGRFTLSSDSLRDEQLLKAFDIP